MQIFHVLIEKHCLYLTHMLKNEINSYHHLVDDIIDNGMLNIKEGAMAVPDKPGLGVSLDQDKLKEFSQLAKKYRDAKETSITGDPLLSQHVPLLPRG